MNSRFRASSASVACAWAVALALAPTLVRAAGSAVMLNLAPGDAKSLTSALRGSGLTVATGVDGESVPAGARLVILNSREKLTNASAHAIGDFVQAGGSLLVTLDESAGRDAFTCSFMLPTMAWEFVDKAEGPLVADSFSTELLGADAATEFKSLSVPYAHMIRPFDAVERGEAIYDQFRRHDLLFGSSAILPADSHWWARPLLNRDWHVQLRTGGVRDLPLLITGRYGLGHVAVFASGPEALDGSPSGPRFWQDVVKWLTTDNAARGGPAESIPAPAITVDAQKRTLSVALSNPGSSTASVTVIGRVMTWEPALIGDVEKDVEVPAGGKATVELPLPPLDENSYAAVAARDEYDVRLGILSAGGAKLLSETTVHADLRPSLLATLRTDDTRNYTWPFEPGQHFDPKLRMGVFLGEYAYKPGETVHTKLMLDNGTRNIAPMAKAADETNPENDTISSLNDGHASAQVSSEDVIASGTWTGRKGDNAVTLTFPRPVQMNGVVLIGQPGGDPKLARSNPGSVVVEIDGRQVGADSKLDAQFTSDNGQVRLNFPATSGKQLRLRLPWTDDGDRTEPMLGDVQVWGSLNDTLAPAMSTEVKAVLRDTLTGATLPIASKQIELGAGGHQEVDLDVATPKTDGKPAFYKIEVAVGGQTVSTPVMTVDPDHVLPSIGTLKDNTVSQGFIVTRGFRNIFKTGTGTKENPPHSAWETPDDLVWAYEHALKEDGAGSKYQAAKLYVTDDDMKHYSTQWRHFLNGENFYDVATAPLLASYEAMPAWKTSKVALVSHSDRWDSGPPVSQQYSWQEFVAFDQWLAAKKIGRLTGKTKRELVADIQEKFMGPWYAYHLEHYAASVAEMRKAFADAGKRLIISAQGCPLVPPAFAADICAVICGTSDDCTWGMVHNDEIRTTGREMGAMAFNPYLQMSTLLQWGYNSNTLNNPQWHAPIGTTEPSRRYIYDRAFRGTIRLDGNYTSMHSFGFNANAGEPFTTTEVDYAQWGRARALHTLLLPDAPLGVGFVVCDSYLSDPLSTRFAADPSGSPESQTIMRSLAGMERAGISVPFSANVLCLNKWTGTAPLIVLNPQHLTPDEVKILAATIARGVHVAAFCSGTEGKTLSPEAAALFGVDATGRPGEGGQTVGRVGDRSIVARGLALFIPLNPDVMTKSELDSITPLLLDKLSVPIKFGPGSTGYGFVSNARTFIVVQDWAEIPRVIQVRYTSPETDVRAINVNDHVDLPVHRDGADVVIDVATRPGDGNLICVQGAQTH